MAKMIKTFKIRRIVKVLRRKVEVDTQRMRGYILTTLEQLFKMSSDFALGKVETQVNEATGKQEHLSIFQRQQWASIAGYTAQVMKSLADGFDERTIDADLAMPAPNMKKAPEAIIELGAGTRSNAQSIIISSIKNINEKIIPIPK